MKTPDEILQQNGETYQDKNDDYGDSWRLVGETLALWLEAAGEDDATVPADPDTLASLGLFTRRLDKIIRAFNAEIIGGELNYESVMDAHTDESTYAAMHAALTQEPETVEFVNESTTEQDVPPEWKAEYQRRVSGN